MLSFNVIWNYSSFQRTAFNGSLAVGLRRSSGPDRPDVDTFDGMAVSRWQSIVGALSGSPIDMRIVRFSCDFSLSAASPSSRDQKATRILGGSQ